jgi:DivIVA domain-containing protein
MDNASSSHSILDTLRTVEFRLGLKGYNVDEVDEYLEKAAVEAEQVQERLRSANERLRLATERVAQLEEELEHPQAERTVALHPGAPEAPSAVTAPAPHESAVSNDALQRTLFLAQKFVDQAKRESEAEAARLVSQAEERARSLLAQAEERARQLTSEAEERLRDEVARLEGARERLAGDVEAMSRHLEDQRTKIRTSLAEMLRWIDERMTMPARSSGEPPTERSPVQPAAGRKAPAERVEGAGSAAGGEPVGAGATGSGAPGGAGSGSLAAARQGETRPPAPAPQPGAVERHPSAAAPSNMTTAPDRTQTPVGARPGTVHQDLFGAGRDETAELERSRIGE